MRRDGPKELINSLARMGFITDAHAQVLHSLRFMGSAALHEVKPHSQEELKAAFKVIEHLLNEVYIIPTLGEELPRRE